MRPNPDEVIDSWEDLYNRKDMKIFAIEGSAIYKFIQINKDKNEMARDFASRLETFQILDLIELKYPGVIYEKLFHGYAVPFIDYAIVDCKFLGAREFKDIVNLCKKIHVSKQSSAASAYSIGISRSMINKDVQSLNKM